MKKTLSLVLAFCLIFTLFACAKEPKEKLPDEVKKYVSENFRITKGIHTSEPINVDVASIMDVKEGEKWIVLGTYTVKVGDEILSSEFGMIATYDEDEREFIFSDEEFGEFS